MCIEDRPEGGALAGEGKHGSINFDGRHNMGVNRNVGDESPVSVAPATGLGAGGMVGATGETGVRNLGRPTSRTNRRPEYSRPRVRASAIPRATSQYSPRSAAPNKF